MLCLIACVNLSPAADDEKEAAVKKEMKMLEGTWKVVSVESNGRKAADDEIKDFHYVYGADGKWKLMNGDQTLSEGTYKLDPSKSPKTIDYAIEKAPVERDKGKSSLGIYELDGDRLRVCRAWPGKDKRSAEFAAGADSECILAEYKRVKP
jgi:uncharacterized protein (TIGR03067 family)